MRTFLLWRGRGALDEVAARLDAILDPLVSVQPRTTAREAGGASLLFAEQPVRGWRMPFSEEDGERWALAIDYPFRAGAPTAQDDGRPLVALARRLDEAPAAAIDEVAPPFALVWGAHSGDEIRVQNDGLGQAQLFEYNDGKIWALTNRVSALQALGVVLEPEPLEWAVRAALGWFPIDLTGYRNVRFLAPGTRLVAGPHGIRRAAFEVLGRWLHPDRLSSAECLELARSSLRRMIETAAPLWERPSVGLSGGWDTRAVVSSLLAAGSDFSARVRGSPERPDVVVARQLARVGGFDIRVRTEAGLPPEDVDACRRSISLALRWQGGYMATSKHKSFLAHGPGLDGGVVNVMGQHGEIGRAYYAKRIQAGALPEHQHEAALVSSLLAKAPPFTRGTLQEPVADVVRTAFRQASGYGLTGLRRLDFFYLYERTRRWASGSLSSQDGLVFAPFLNPDYVRAVFAFEGDMAANPFHRAIVRTNVPEWVDVRFAEDFARRRRAGADWRRPQGNRHYDSRRYWSTTGAPLIQRALGEGGWWTELFDPTEARRSWLDAADELAITYLLPRALADAVGTPAAASTRL